MEPMTLEHLPLDTVDSDLLGTRGVNQALRALAPVRPPTSSTRAAGTTSPSG